jgi:flagellar biogenesis protein FliO
MTARLYRHIARPKSALPDFARLLQSLLRRFTLPRRPAAQASLQLLESVSLGAETSIALVRFDREALVLGVTPQSVTLLIRRESSAVSGEVIKTQIPLP